MGFAAAEMKGSGQQVVSATEELGDIGESAPLSDAMLTMDVVDTLKASPALAEAADAAPQLRALYARLGIRLEGDMAEDGLAAYRADAFLHVPRRGAAAALARLYVARRRWAPGVIAAIVLLVLGFGGYFLLYQPYQQSRAAEALAELRTAVPAQLDELYQSIFDETKVQQAATAAAAVRDQGKAAALKGDRDGADAALAALVQIRDTLSVGYSLHIVDRPDVKWGFWSFPEDYAAATDYYLVVEARDAAGNPVAVPVTDSASGRTDRVLIWALRVPEDVYRAVEADKADDGRIQHDLVGIKDTGFLEPDYTVDVLGGSLTRW